MKRVRPYLIALIILASVGAIAVAHRFDPAQPSQLADKLLHSLHGPGFAAVALVLFAAFRRYRRGPSNYLQAGVAAMAIGVLSEAAQIPGPRDAQVSDLIVDGIGIVGVLGILALFDREITSLLRKRHKRMLAITSIVALAATFSPTFWYGYVIVEQSRAMPRLITFEHLWETATYRQSHRRRPELRASPSGWPGSGDTVAYAEESGRSGIFIRLYPYPDWSGYSSLRFVAASGSSSSHDIMIAIRDIRPGYETNTNRYTERFIVGPDPSWYEISLEKVRAVEQQRPFDIGHVESLVLSATTPGSQATILMGDFRLE